MRRRRRPRVRPPRFPVRHGVAQNPRAPPAWLKPWRAPSPGWAPPGGGNLTCVRSSGFLLASWVCQRIGSDVLYDDARKLYAAFETTMVGVGRLLFFRDLYLMWYLSSLINGRGLAKKKGTKTLDCHNCGIAVSAAWHPDFSGRAELQKAHGQMRWPGYTAAIKTIIAAIAGLDLQQEDRGNGGPAAVAAALWP